MKKFLSVDWDYFVDASLEDRCYKFPDGGNEDLDFQLQNIVWRFRYNDHPEIKKMGLNEDYNSLMDILTKFLMYDSRNPIDSQYKILVGLAISHKYIYQYILDRTQPDEEFEVYNVDFHHDMYYYRDPRNPLNCGNWVRELLKERPNMKYYWIKREDSEIALLGGEEIPKEMIVPFKDLIDKDFDYIFMCRSDIWSPPHLDKTFNIICRMCKTYARTEVMDKLEESDREITYK